MMLTILLIFVVQKSCRILFLFDQSDNVSSTRFVLDFLFQLFNLFGLQLFTKQPQTNFALNNTWREQLKID